MLNISSMIFDRQLFILLLASVPLQVVNAYEFTGRFSMLGATAKAESGDIGYQSPVGDTLTADQQGLRLMLDEATDIGEWSIHLRGVRQHLSGYPYTDSHSSDLFRYSVGGGNLLDDSDGTTTTTVDYGLDHAVYRHRFGSTTLGMGRQPIDWGSGRFWQPMNVFGAFAPTDLDTEYKPGIDSVSLDWYPGAFSSVTAVYTFAPHDDSEIKDSGAVHYRRAVGVESEMALVAGSIIGNRVFGGSFESAWKGMGWRVEGLYYQLEEDDEKAFFWIAGVDYQFDDGTILNVELHDNSRGATHESELASIVGDPLVVSGLQQQMSRHVLGVGLSRYLTPLLQGSYTLLTSTLNDSKNKRQISLIHQLNLTYSVSNESDLLMSVMVANGKGLSDSEEPQSEYGHLPMSLTLRLRFYF